MKITAIETALTRSAPPGRRVWGFIRLKTDEELVGLGQCQVARGLHDVLDWIGPLLIGANPLEIEVLSHRVYHATSYQGGQGGWVVHIWSGIETALWDLAGKYYGAPIAQLLGGKFRDKVRIYADLHAGETREPASWAERARWAVDKGFTAIKFDLDAYVKGFYGGGWEDRRPISNPELYEMVEQVRAVREAIGPTIDLALDCHWSYTTVDAIRLGNALAPFDPLFFEDPVPPEDFGAMKEVTEHVAVPTCTGESLFTRRAWVPLIEARAIKIAAPDLMKGGGLLEGKKIADMCELHAIPLCPHNTSTPVGTLAQAHLCAAIPNFIALEFHSIDEPRWQEFIVGDWPVIEEGYITIPEAPGLGVELNDDFVKELTIEASAGFYMD